MPRLIPVASIPNQQLTQSAQITITSRQKIAFGVLLATLTTLLLLDRSTALLWFVGALTLIYLVNCLVRIAFAGFSLGRTAVELTEAEIEAARIDAPLISAFIPVRREGLPILRHLAERLQALDYPADRLEILLLLDADEDETIANATIAMPEHVTIMAIEPAAPRTKPRVMNDALRYAKGEYIVVWDVEDAPDPQQLLKAVAAFRRCKKNDPQVACLQGQLAFDPNLLEKPNLLTNWQAAAYNLHFRMTLPALDRLGLPVPLGGTSNIFDAAVLREIGGWDAWNVTEDLDLGVRLARHGYKVRMIDSTTWEEPNPLLGNCIRQWSRWKKGGMQTYLVHMRQPLALLRDLGPMRFLSFQITVGVPPLVLLANPIFILMTLLYWGAGASWVSTFFPYPVLYAANFSLIVGNLFFIFAIATASLHREQYGLVPAALFSVGHWFLMIIAAYKAFWQLLTRRSHHWEVTQHGHAESLLPSSSGAQQEQSTLQA